MDCANFLVNIARRNHWTKLRLGCCLFFRLNQMMLFNWLSSPSYFCFSRIASWLIALFLCFELVVNRLSILICNYGYFADNRLSRISLLLYHKFAKDLIIALPQTNRDLFFFGSRKSREEAQLQLDINAKFWELQRYIDNWTAVYCLFECHQLNVFSFIHVFMCIYTCLF